MQHLLTLMVKKSQAIMKTILNKRGNEIVEAAIVLPVFVLIVVSLIGVCLFKYNAFKVECEVQREVVDAIRNDKSVIKIIEKATESSGYPGGLFNGVMYSVYTPYGYAVDEEIILRTGEFVDLI